MILDKIILILALIYLLWLMHFLYSAKMWQDIGLPPIADYYYFQRLKEKMRPTGWVVGRNRKGFGSAKAASHKKAYRS